MQHPHEEVTTILTTIGFVGIFGGGFSGWLNDYILSSRFSTCMSRLIGFVGIFGGGFSGWLSDYILSSRSSTYMSRLCVFILVVV